MVIYGIIVDSKWADSVGPFLSDCIETMTGRYAGHKCIRATAIGYTMPHLVATVRDLTQDFVAELHIPHGQVLLIVSAERSVPDEKRSSIGFLAQQP